MPPAMHMASCCQCAALLRTAVSPRADRLPQLAGAAVALARHVLAALDFRQHAASHPRLGSVDHVSCHPLGTCSPGSLQQAAAAARQIGGARAPASRPLNGAMMSCGWAAPPCSPGQASGCRKSI